MKEKTLTRPWTSGFNYAQYFGDITVLNQLQMRPEEREWLARPPKDPSPAEAILYLGCNVLRTGHLVRTVSQVFKLLEVDFTMVGGLAYCCGIVHYREGDKASGESMGRNTLEYFTRFQAKTVVCWCPSCIYNYDQLMHLPSPVPLVHATQFLAERLDRLRPLFSQEVPQRVALHQHTANPQTDLEARSARTLLSAIPGLELVDLEVEPRLGRTCSFQGRSQPEWHHLVTPSLEQAVARGADTLGTIYHGCQGCLGFYEARYPLAVENYITLLGRALGIEYPDLYKKYALLGDEEAILAHASPCMQINHVSEAKAREVAQRSFGA